MRIQDPVTKRIVELEGENPTADLRYRILVGRYNWRVIDEQGRVVKPQAAAGAAKPKARKGK